MSDTTLESGVVTGPDTEVRVELVRPGVALVTLNRPEAFNAISVDFVQEFNRRFTDIAADTSIRAVVMTGAGRAFCAGGDLKDVSKVGVGRSTPQQAMEVQDAAASMVTRLVSMPQPVIAAVNGAAAGGGLVLALACDVRICSTAAKFAAAFVRIGLASEMGASFLLPRVAGPSLGFEMLLTGRKVDADEALQNRMVLRVVEPDRLLDEAIGVAEQIVQNSPFGVSTAKRLLWASLQSSNLQSSIDFESAAQMLCARTEDQREALAAFMERRSPSFSNS